METFYIVDPNAPVFSVWARHNPQSPNKPGYFTRDFDAAYARNIFAYPTQRGAIRQAQRIMAEHNLNEIEVMGRSQLFAHLNVEDWSNGF